MWKSVFGVYSVNIQYVISVTRGQVKNPASGGQTQLRAHEISSGRLKTET